MGGLSLSIHPVHKAESLSQDDDVPIDHWTLVWFLLHRSQRKGFQHFHYYPRAHISSLLWNNQR